MIQNRSSGIASGERAGPIRWLSAFLKIDPPEFWTVQVFFLFLTTIGMFYTIGGTAADTMLLSRLSNRELQRNLPLVYIGTAVVSVFMTWIYSRIQERVERRLLLPAVQLAMAGSVLLLRFLIGQWPGGSSIYFLTVIWLESCALISIMLFYSYAGDFFTSREARRLYGYINGGLALGTVVAGYSIRPLVQHLGTDNLLLVVAFLQAAQTGWTLLVRRSRHAAGRMPPVTRPGGCSAAESIWRDPYLITIILLVLAELAAFRFVDYQFQISASRIMKEEQLAIFYGWFYGFTGMAELILLTLVVRRVLGKFGALKCMMLMPVQLIGASFAFMAGPHVLMAALVNFLRLSFYETVDVPARELLFLPLPGRLRLRAQAVLTGAVIPLGSGLGGVLLLLMGAVTGELRFFALAAVCLAGLWLTGLIILKRYYRRTLARSLRRYDLAPADIPGLLRSVDVRHLLQELLSSGESGQISLGLDLLQPDLRKIPPTAIVPFTSHPDAFIAGKAWHLLRQKGEPLEPAVFVRGMEDPRDEVRAAAILAYSRAGREQANASVSVCLLDHSEPCRQSAMAGLLRYGGIPGAMTVYPQLEAMTASPRDRDRIFAARVMGLAQGRRFHAALRTLLQDEDFAVRRQAVLACAELREPSLLPRLIELMADGRMRPVAARAIRGMPAKAWPLLDREAGRECHPLPVRLYLLKLAAVLGGRESAGSLWRVVHSRAPFLLRVSAGRALRRFPGAMDDGWQAAEQAAESLLGELSLLLRSRQECAGMAAGDFFQDRSRLVADLLFSIWIVRFECPELKTVEQNLLGLHRLLQDNALELLEVILPRTLAERIAPLLGSLYFRRGNRRGRGLSPRTAVRFEKTDRWLQAILCVAGVQNNNEERGARAMTNNSQEMVQMIGTVAYLKRVPLFQDIPAEYLAGLLEEAEQFNISGGSVLFAEGESGDALYIIRNGSLELQYGQSRRLILEAGGYTGETAVLDGGPQPCTCRALEECQLIKISAENFFQLLDLHPEMARSILAALSERNRIFMAQQ